MQSRVSFLSAEVFAELRAIPGVHVRNGVVTFPEDCASLLIPFGVTTPVTPPAPRPLACDVTKVVGWSKLRSWQQDCAVALANGTKKLVWHVAGAGKTATLLAGARLLGSRKTLILTRAIGIRSFLRDTRWCSRLHIEPVTGRGLDFKIHAAYDADAIVVNYEVLDARLDDLLKLKFDLLICDESHYLRSYKYKGYARWAKAAEQLSAQIWRAKGDIWEATATPVRDRRRDLYRQLVVLHPDGRWGSSWSWAHYFCDAKPGQYGGLDTTGKSHTQELVTRISFYMDRRTKADVMKELPAKTRERVQIEIPNKKWRHPNGIEAALAEAAEAKVPTGIEMAVDVLSGPGKVILVTNRRLEVPRIVRELEKAVKGLHHLRKLQVFAVTGEIEPIKRGGICQNYLEADDPACLVATIDSISESIDLQRTDALIVLALPYTPGSVEQLEGRVARLGQDRRVTVFYLIALGTIDEEIEETLLSKLADTEDLQATTAADGLSATLRNVPSDEEISAKLNAWLAGVNCVTDED